MSSWSLRLTFYSDQVRSYKNFTCKLFLHRLRQHKNTPRCHGMTSRSLFIVYLMASTSAAILSPSASPWRLSQGSPSCCEDIELTGSGARSRGLVCATRISESFEEDVDMEGGSGRWNERWMMNERWSNGGMRGVREMSREKRVRGVRGVRGSLNNSSTFVLLTSRCPTDLIDCPMLNGIVIITIIVFAVVSVINAIIMIAITLLTAKNYIVN